MKKISTLISLCFFVYLVSNAQSSYNALSFDGTGSYVQTSATPVNIPTGSSPFTTETWIKTTNSDAGAIITWGAASTNQFNGLELSAGNLIAFFYGNDLSVTSANISDGQWHHIAVSYDGATRSIYIDGAMAATQNLATQPNVSSSAVYLGNSACCTHILDGTLDEVRIWNVSRTQMEIQQYMHVGLIGTETGLVALFNFNQGIANGDNTAISIEPDRTASGNNGTLNNFARTGSTSNYVAGVPNMYTLPVSLISFTATEESGHVHLSWATASEKNSGSFSLERSNNGRYFYETGTVPAAGNASSVNNYTFIDNKPTAGVNFYRLKIIDIDGKLSYSKVLMVNLSLDGQLAVYPNPASESITVHCTNNKGSLLLLDATGRLVKTIVINESGDISTSVDISQLKTGMYFVRSDTQIVKFIKQ